MFDFKAFYLGLPQDQRDAYAAAAGTSPAYVNLHLIRGRRVPRPALMRALATACAQFGASPTLAEFSGFFFQDPDAGSEAPDASAEPAPEPVST